MVALICSMCGAKLELDENKPYVTCSFCDTQFLLKDLIGAQSITKENWSNPLLDRAFLLLEDDEFEKANNLFEKYLRTVNAKNPQVYMGKMLAELEIKDITLLKQYQYSISDNNNFQKALRFADPILKEQLVECDNIVQNNSNKRIAAEEMKKEEAKQREKIANEYRKQAGKKFLIIFAVFCSLLFIFSIVIPFIGYNTMIKDNLFILDTLNVHSISSARKMSDYSKIVKICEKNIQKDKSADSNNIYPLLESAKKADELFADITVTRNNASFFPSQDYDYTQVLILYNLPIYLEEVPANMRGDISIGLLPYMHINYTMEDNIKPENIGYNIGIIYPLSNEIEFDKITIDVGDNKPLSATFDKNAISLRDNSENVGGFHAYLTFNEEDALRLIYAKKTPVIKLLKGNNKLVYEYEISEEEIKYMEKTFLAAQADKEMLEILYEWYTSAQKKNDIFKPFDIFNLFTNH